MSSYEKYDETSALDAFVAEHDARRPELGQITFLSATRGSRGSNRHPPPPDRPARA